jgi:uncharacterized membrane protein YqjE
MDTRAPVSGGLLGSLRGLADTVIVSARERLELLGLELQEEKLRFVQSLIWIAAAVFTAMLAITFASITIVFLFWETARLAVLIGLTTFYAIAFGWVLWKCRDYLTRQPRPFDATLNELQKDSACIRPRS